MDINDDLELFKTQEATHFAQVILPFATPKPFTFHIPDVDCFKIEKRGIFKIYELKISHNNIRKYKTTHLSL